MNQQEKENIIKFVDFLTKFTVRIVKADSTGTMKGMCSGFLYQPNRKYPPTVITAGHHMPTQGAFIETRIVEGGQTLCINAGKFEVFCNYDDIDFAYSDLPIDTIRKDLRNLNKPTKIDYVAYSHRFVRAEKSEVYGFAVWNNYEAIQNGKGLLLPRYCCYEVGMELADQDKHINYFKTASDLKDDEYYQGASGSPVADP